MKLFLLLYLLIYGGIHAYFYFRLQAAFVLSLPVKLAAIVCLAFMVLCPIFVRILERQGHETLATAYSYLGYLWMGGVFLFFCLALLMDLYRCLIWGINQVGAGLPYYLVLSSKTAFISALILAAAASLYGYAEAKRITIEHVTIQSAKIPPQIGKVRIVQISDVHLGLIVHGERLSKMLAAVREARPDILVSTGDLVDGQLDNLHRSVEPLKSISPKYGKYAVTGNHEFFAGPIASIKFTQDAGFRMLRGEAATIENAIRIVGVDDPAGRQMGADWVAQEDGLFAAGKGAPLFTVLLKHQPVVRKSSLGAFDLQLSGHTHKGQIFPFNLVTRAFYPMQSGYYRLPKDSVLYVSRGTGTWGPPVRLLSPPEVTVIDLVHK